MRCSRSAEVSRTSSCFGMPSPTRWESSIGVRTATSASSSPRGDVTAGVGVGALLGARGAATGLDLDLLAGAAGLERRIPLPYVQKTGLALSGFDEYLRTGRVLIFGESEIRFLERMTPDDRAVTLRRLFQRDFPCVMITMGLDGPPELAVEAERAGVPLLRTALTTPVAIARLTNILEDRLAPRETRHGVLMDILGLGVFLTGARRIGKS